METLKQTCIWLSKDLEILTTLTLTPTCLSYTHMTKTISLPFSNIIGCKIPEPCSQTFEVLFYNPTKDQFKRYEFTSPSHQQAKSWCESIENALSPQTPRRICFIINPKSGNCKGVKVFTRSIMPVLSYSSAPYDFFTSTCQTFIEDLIQKKDFSVYSEVICLGGDGTFAQVINSMKKHSEHLLEKLAFGVIPLGSRNALSCELNGKSLNKSIFNSVKGVSFRGDLMKVKVNDQEILATCAVSWGLISDASDEAQHWRAFGPLRYNLVAAKKFFTKWKRYTGSISFRDSSGQMTSVKSDYVFSAIGNHKVLNSHNLEVLMPFAKVNDGKLDLMMMFFTGKLKTLSAFMKMQKGGAHASLPYFKFFKTDCVKIEAGNLRVFNVDGEIFYGDSIEIESVPSGIQYVGSCD